MIVTKKIFILSKIYFLIFIIFFLFIYNNSNAQLRKTIDSVQAIEQNCLDSGISGRHMENCSCEFRYQVDSILNIVYNNVRRSLNAQQKETLKQEELVWLKKREANHDKSRKESYREGMYGHDVGAIACEADADYVKERIFILIKKWDFKKIYSN